MKYLGWIISIALLVVLVLQAFDLLTFSDPEPESLVLKSESHIVLEQVQGLGKLELVKHHYKDIIELEKVVPEQSIKDFLKGAKGKKMPWESNPKVVLIAEGEAIACVDLLKIEEKHITVNDSILYVILPSPELCVWKIDHDKSRVYDYKDEHRLDPKGLLMEEAFKLAEKEIRNTAINAGIEEEAKTMAERVLIPLFEAITDKKVVVQFARFENSGELLIPKR